MEKLHLPIPEEVDSQHPQPVSNASAKKESRNIMLFDLSIYGHHPVYIRHLIRYWYENDLLGHLYIVVSDSFMTEHSDVIAFAKTFQHNSVSFKPITPAEEAELKPRHSFLSRTQRGFQEWKLLQKYTEVINPAHCLLMYFDTCAIPIAMGKQLPCNFSGLYFRPTFHYDKLPNYEHTWTSRIQKIREQLTLSLVLRNPHLSSLLCLDEFSVDILNHLTHSVEFVHLPDPVDICVADSLKVESIRKGLNISPGRKVCLLFGALTSRKGIDKLLDAALLLSAETCKQLCFVFIGEAGKDNQARFNAQIETVCKQQPIQIIQHYEFVPEEDVSAYFQLADLVLAPYQRHVGMSGILLWAAAWKTPVLSSNYGLMGKVVQDHSLGISVDSESSAEIAIGLEQFLYDGISEYCNQDKMEKFAEQNSAQRFAEVIFQKIL